MKKGFTLIEIVVVVSVLSVLMITITGVLINSFRARNRVDVGNRLEQNGNYVLMELKNNFMKAGSMKIDCSNEPISIGFTNIFDGEPITLSCTSDGKIASISAGLGTTAYLTSKEVVVSDCDNFVTCVPSSDGVGAANFSFVLSTGVSAAGTENFISRKFETKVVVRN